MNKIFERLKQEFLGVIPTAIFFLIAFQLLAFTRDLIVQIWLFVLFFLYCVLTELVRVLGRERVQSMFLGSIKPGGA